MFLYVKFYLGRGGRIILYLINRDIFLVLYCYSNLYVEFEFFFLYVVGIRMFYW